MPSRRTLAAALALVASLAGRGAAAQVITFNSVPVTFNDIVTSITTQGYTFTSPHFHVINNPGFFGAISDGTIYIAEEGTGSPGFTTGLPITMSGPAPFSLARFDAGPETVLPSASNANATFVELLGTYAGGGTVSTSFALVPGAFTTFVLPAGWNDLASVLFTGTIPGVSGNASLALDNIDVSASVAPEPAALALLAPGLLALGAAARRRRA